MFDCIIELILQYIEFLGFYVPIFLVGSFIGHAIKAGGE